MSNNEAGTETLSDIKTGYRLLFYRHLMFRILKLLILALGIFAIYIH